MPAPATGPYVSVPMNFGTAGAANLWCLNGWNQGGGARHRRRFPKDATKDRHCWVGDWRPIAHLRLHESDALVKVAKPMFDRLRKLYGVDQILPDHDSRRDMQLETIYCRHYERSF